MPHQDFDAWLEEPEPITWTWKGREYTIAGGLPTRLVLKMQKAGKPDAAILEEIIGAEQWEALVESTNTQQFDQITEWAITKAMGRASQEEEAEEHAPKGESPANPSASPEPTSSSTGAPSSSTRPAIGLVPPTNSEGSATAAS